MRAWNGWILHPFRGFVQRPAPASDLAQEILFALEDGLLLVNVQIGQETYRLSIDSGAPLTSLHRDRCGASIRGLKGERTATRRLGGISDVLKVTLPTMIVGDKRLESVSALILRGGGKTESAHNGVVSPRSLGLKALQFDFSRNQMEFEF